MIRGKHIARQKAYWERCEKEGTPLDKVEKFCREHKICDYGDFISQVLKEDPDLGEWATGHRGIAAKTRGIKARIAKVRKELEKPGGI